MPAPSDLVHETTVTTGTGNITTVNVNGKRSFNTAFGTGGTDLFDYYVSNQSAAEWERGTGHLSAATTLVRDTVIASSNANAAVNFSAGTKDITNDIPAGKQLHGDIVANKNRLINGDFAICQRNGTTATATADNAYWADRWRLLQETGSANTLAALDTAAVINGIIYDGALKFTGTTDKGGIWQVIEGINCKDLRGSQVTFSIYLAVSNVRLGDIRIGIVEFTGTEDSVSGDPITTWGSTGAGITTLAASYAFLNTPANLSVTTSLVRYSVTATCGSSLTNLAVFAWNDDRVYSANDTLYFANAQLELGPNATTFEKLPFSTRLINCARYYEKTYDLLTAPGTATNTGAVNTRAAFASSTNTPEFPFMYTSRKRVAANLTFYNTNSGASGSWRNQTANTDDTTNVGATGQSGFSVYLSGTNALADGIRGHWVAESEL